MKQVVTYGLVAAVAALGFARLAYDQVEEAHLATAEPVAVAVETRAPRALKFHLFELSNGEIILEAEVRDALPADINTVVDVKARKAMFIDTLLPIILKNNEVILQERARLLALKETDISDEERTWLTKLAKKYRVKGTSGESTALIDRLLLHADVIPPSLAMSQAVMESGWGTSRFARLGNALFGQWVWGDAEGILPENRDDGATHRIKSFETISGSVADYMRNLNSHPAYASLRARRAELREHGLAITGEMLAPGLTEYSARGEEYVTEILSIISFNGLAITDLARIAEDGELE